MSVQITQNGIRIATSWEQVRVVLFGAQVSGITAISYASSQDKENFYGAGNEVLERGRGNKTYEASITLTADTVEKIHRALAPGFGIEDIEPFDVPVFYRVEGSPFIHKHYLLFCEFKGRGRQMSQNDMQGVEELELVVGKICYSDEQLAAYRAGSLGL